MTRYTTLAEPVDTDFDRARRKAFPRRIKGYLARVSSYPPSFEESRRSVRALDPVSRGTKAVEAGSISGSVGRRRDSAGAFLPIRASVAARWKREGRAFHRAEELLPRTPGTASSAKSSVQTGLLFRQRARPASFARRQAAGPNREPCGS